MGSRAHPTNFRPQMLLLQPYVRELSFICPAAPGHSRTGQALVTVLSPRLTDVWQTSAPQFWHVRVARYLQLTYLGQRSIRNGSVSGRLQCRPRYPDSCSGYLVDASQRWLRANASEASVRRSSDPSVRTTRATEPGGATQSHTKTRRPKVRSAGKPQAVPAGAGALQFLSSRALRGRGKHHFKNATAPGAAGGSERCSKCAVETLAKPGAVHYNSPPAAVSTAKQPTKSSRWTDRKCATNSVVK